MMKFLKPFNVFSTKIWKHFSRLNHRSQRPPLFDAIERRDLSEVTRLMTSHPFDVNVREFGTHGLRPVERALLNLDYSNGTCERIARVFLEHPRVSVNGESARYAFSKTSLQVLCESGVQSPRAIALLLGHTHRDVTACSHLPLMSCLQQVRCKHDDVMYTASEMLLRQTDVDAGDVLLKLLKTPLKSVTAFELVLAHTPAHSIQLQFALFEILMRVQTLDDVTGHMLQALVRKGVDLNSESPKRRETPLLRFLRCCNDKIHFKTPQHSLEILRYLLEHDADPNKPSYLLAHAVNYCSFDQCRLLLEHGADPNSVFVSEHGRLKLGVHDAGFAENYLETREAAMDCAIRQSSKRKIQLLKDYGAQRPPKDPLPKFSTSKCKMVPEYIGIHYPNPVVIVNKTEIIPGLDDTAALHRHNELFRVKMCRGFLRNAEAIEVMDGVHDFMRYLTLVLRNFLSLDISCEISGSFAENSKCFSPHEFDYVLLVRKSRHTMCATTKLINLTVEYLISNFIYSKYWTLDSRLWVKDLLRGNKISRIHLIWNGEQYKDFDVFIDLPICDERGECIYKEHRIIEVGSLFASNVFETLTHHNFEISSISRLPKTLKHGYILAKAVRIASIAEPDDLQAFDLEENICVDDVITSFILKACLLGQNRATQMQLAAMTSHVEAAIGIYEILEAALRRKVLVSEYSVKRLVDCEHCVVERGCCKKRRLMLAMVENILSWLRVNRHELSDMDFADDVNVSRLFES